MIYSMTGYGRAQETVDGHDITVEIRSVNNRYLDCGIKLPRVYSFAEDAIKTRIQASVSRGKLDIYVTIDSSKASDNVVISLNRPLLAGYLEAFRQMEEYGISNDITTSTLSRLPDILLVEKKQDDPEYMTVAICAVADKALEQFNSMRAREGSSLAADIQEKAKSVAAIVSAIEERSPKTVAEYRARLELKMKETLENTTIEDARILTEAAIFADRVSTDEEQVRLRSHLQQLSAMLSEGGTVGRKLDFLLQELNREANTIGSKSNDTVQARLVVDLKAELEKIREQVQNIE